MTPKMVIKQNIKIPFDKGGGGFTLLEVLVAMVILSVGLLGMASLSIGIIKGNELSKEISSATTCAREKLEDVERSGYAGATIGTVTDTCSSMTGYRRETTVAEVYLVPPDEREIKTVTVIVYWDSDSHQVQLKTFLAK